MAASRADGEVEPGPAAGFRVGGVVQPEIVHIARGSEQEAAEPGLVPATAAERGRTLCAPGWRAPASERVSFGCYCKRRRLVTKVP